MFFCLFDKDEETRFDLVSRQGDVHFGFIPGVRIGQLYGLRADGPYDAPHLFDVSNCNCRLIEAQKLLVVDPAMPIPIPMTSMNST